MPLEPAAPNAASQPPSTCRPQDRVAVAGKLFDLAEARAQRGESLRAFAAANDTPKSTLQDQERAMREDELPTGWRLFFESDVGLRFTLRLMIAVLVFFVLRGGCGVELVAEFFEAMHLRRYVASSPSTLRRVFDRILTDTHAWGEAQRARLATRMVRRDVVLALDENFHWEKAMLVALDVMSGYLFCETLSDRYDSASWEKTLRASLVGHNVCVRAVTRDGGTWLGVCAQGLGVPAGPDNFHLQYAVCKATAGTLATRVRRTEKKVQEAKDNFATLRAARAQEEAAPRRPGRPPAWDAQESFATLAIVAAEHHATEAREQREAMQASIRELGDVHHPVDLATGKAVDADAARTRLEKVAEKMAEHAASSKLSERAVKAIHGLAQSFDDLVGIVRWWHQEVRRQLVALPVALSALEVAWIETVLVPALYVQHRITLARDEAQRASLQTLWARLSTELIANSPWASWDAEQRRAVQDLVCKLVTMFPRSTSAVEGRNGQDSLCHHQHHTLSDEFRKARLVVHNFVATRRDGTTAAERLFGAKPGDLLEYLCERIKLPARGRHRAAGQKETPLALTG